MANKTLHNKKALLEALEKSLGVVTSACRLVGVSRVTYYDYYNKDKEFRASVDELSNVALDFAESQLHKQIKDGVPASTIFYLKTKGKHRGYIESHRVEYTNDTPTPVSREEVEESIKSIAAMMEGKLTVTKKTA